MRGQQHAPAALYPREKTGTHCTGGWVGPRAGLDSAGNLALTGFRFPDRLARSQSLYRLGYRAHRLLKTYNSIFQISEKLYLNMLLSVPCIVITIILIHQQTHIICMKSQIIHTLYMNSPICLSKKSPLFRETLTKRNTAFNISVSGVFAGGQKFKCWSSAL